MRLIKLILVFSILFFSCKRGDKDKFYYYQEAVLEFNKQVGAEGKKVVIIIPNEGCGGCISSASNYIYNNLDKIDDKFLVVYTGVRDMKHFNMTFPKKMFENKNIIIDKGDIFMGENVSSIYPQIIRIQKSVISEVKVFDVYDIF